MVGDGGSFINSCHESQSNHPKLYQKKKQGKNLSQSDEHIVKHGIRYVSRKQGNALTVCLEAYRLPQRHPDGQHV